VIDLSAQRLARAAGGHLLAGDLERAGPERAVIDSRTIEPGDLFVGLPGAAADGGRFAPAALDA
jgi:UDP-N-acetylmuramoyl-tripeptide--D-alanyl-D-alanine ligase